MIVFYTLVAITLVCFLIAPVGLDIASDDIKSSNWITPRKKRIKSLIEEKFVMFGFAVTGGFAGIGAVWWWPEMMPILFLIGAFIGLNYGSNICESSLARRLGEESIYAVNLLNELARIENEHSFSLLDEISEGSNWLKKGYENSDRTYFLHDRTLDAAKKLALIIRRGYIMQDEIEKNNANRYVLPQQDIAQIDLCIERLIWLSSEIYRLSDAEEPNIHCITEYDEHIIALRKFELCNRMMTYQEMSDDLIID